MPRKTILMVRRRLERRATDTQASYRQAPLVPLLPISCYGRPMNDDGPHRATRPEEDAVQPRHAGHGAVPGDQDGQSGQPAVLSAWAISTSCSSRMPRLPRATSASRSPSAASTWAHDIPDVRRAGACGGRLSAAADPHRPPGGRLRAAGGSGRSPQARLEIGGEARRRPAGDARHADRGQPARFRAATISSPAIARQQGDGRNGPRLGRHHLRRAGGHAHHAGTAGSRSRPSRTRARSSCRTACSTSIPTSRHPRRARRHP